MSSSFCTVIRKPLFKCFIHMLREVNPQVAANIESSPSAPTASRGKSKKASRYINKVDIILLGAGISLERQTAYPDCIDSSTI